MDSLSVFRERGAVTPASPGTAWHQKLCLVDFYAPHCIQELSLSEGRTAVPTASVPSRGHLLRPHGISLVPFIRETPAVSSLTRGAYRSCQIAHSPHPGKAQSALFTSSSISMGSWVLSLLSVWSMKVVHCGLCLLLLLSFA